MKYFLVSFRYPNITELSKMKYYSSANGISHESYLKQENPIPCDIRQTQTKLWFTFFILEILIFVSVTYIYRDFQ